MGKMQLPSFAPEYLTEKDKETLSMAEVTQAYVDGYVAALKRLHSRNPAQYAGTLEAAIRCIGDDFREIMSVFEKVDKLNSLRAMEESFVKAQGIRSLYFCRNWRDDTQFPFPHDGLESNRRTAFVRGYAGAHFTQYASDSPLFYIENLEGTDELWRYVVGDLILFQEELQKKRKAVLNALTYSIRGGKF